MTAANSNVSLFASPKRHAMPFHRPSVLLALAWYSTGVHRGIAQYAEKVGWSLDIGMTRSGRPPARWRGDGIIGVFGMNSGLDSLMQRAKIPVVHVGNAGCSGVPRVGSDNLAVGRMAAEYFLGKGFRNFSFYVRSDSLGEYLRRLAFEDRVRLAGRNVTLLDGLRKGRSSRESIAKQLGRMASPLAIFAEYDDLAIEVLDACKNAGIAVPDRVAILGASNDPLRCQFASVPLSSIDDDQEMIGFQAARILDHLMRKNPDCNTPVFVAPKGVITRRSTDILAVEHPHVAAAVRAIGARYTEQVTAKEIAAGISMSYRRLHEAFLVNIGHTIYDEITRKRLDHAKRLLEGTGKKTSEIALLSGFTDETRMSKVFARVLGITPSNYRRRIAR